MFVLSDVPDVDGVRFAELGMLFLPMIVSLSKIEFKDHQLMKDINLPDNYNQDIYPYSPSPSYVRAVICSTNWNNSKTRN